MSDPGKLGTAPCGHPGRAVFGNFYICIAGCDGPPKASDPAVIYERDPGDEFEAEDTKPDGVSLKCARCGSSNTAPFPPGPHWHCWPCGHVW